MKITVIGASGRIGTRLVEKLRQTHAEVITASPSLGVNSATGEGLAPASYGRNQWPEQFDLDEIARVHMTANEDTRAVVTDDKARCYGVRLNDDMFLPHKDARMGSMRYVDWLNRSMAN